MNAKRVKIKELPGGSIKIGSCIMTSHFIKRWKERISSSLPPKEIAIKAYEKLKFSKLIHLENNTEHRIYGGLIFLVKRTTKHNIVVTVMVTKWAREFNEPMRTKCVGC